MLLYISRICADNFKVFSNLHIITEGKSVVLFGANGMGKSTVLDVINYSFWSWLYRLNQAQGVRYRSFSPEIVKTGSGSSRIESEVVWDEKKYIFLRTYVKATVGKRAKSSRISVDYKYFIERLVTDYLEKDKDIPVFVSYGTNRSVLDIPLKIKKKHDFSILASIEKANELDFRTFFEWYRNQEDIENEIIKEQNDINYVDKSLDCVRRAITAMLGDNYTDLKVKRSPLCMKVRKDSTEVRVDQLSDGEKCTIALFGDLARRMAIANPNKVNPLEGEGIVLIDEIELHLHPTWQRRVLCVLKDVFPNIQFIITTHSPQVLGEADDRYKVLGLFMDNNHEVIVSERYIYGKASNDILNTVMATSERSDKVKKMFSEFYRLLDYEIFDRAEIQLKQIEGLIGCDDPEVVSCRIKLNLERM